MEVIHTTAGHYGYDEPLGDLDFYPNGGSWQVPCGNDVPCSHSFSFIMLAESIRADNNPGAARFIGTACESFEQAAEEECTGSRDAIFGGIAVKTTLVYYYYHNIIITVSSPFMSHFYLRAPLRKGFEIAYHAAYLRLVTGCLARKTLFLPIFSFT